MRIYLSAIESYPFIFEDYRNVEFKPRILSSFFYSKGRNAERIFGEYKDCIGDIIIDSGAFTFRQKKSLNPDWTEYVRNYGAFLKANNIEKFFELDIDNIVGYSKVKDYRNMLEDIVGKQCIPVWHVNRGKEEFLNHCENYNYVSLGGIAGGQDKIGQNSVFKNLFPWFVKEAHLRKCKIHGLGVTNISILRRSHFDSVDSTSWQKAMRYGLVDVFDGERMKSVKKPENKKVIYSKELVKNVFGEWVKFSEYAERCL